MSTKRYKGEQSMTLRGQVEVKISWASVRSSGAVVLAC